MPTRVYSTDVTAVFDHGKRDVSAFPIATGTYYKVDYSAGLISPVINVPVPTSYMAEKSDYDFVGAIIMTSEAGYCMLPITMSLRQETVELGYGILAGRDRNLTDENGLIELMTGVFTDNQPDFTWLAPYEEGVCAKFPSAS